VPCGREVCGGAFTVASEQNNGTWALILVPFAIFHTNRKKAKHTERNINTPPIVKMKRLTYFSTKHLRNWPNVVCGVDSFDF